MKISKRTILTLALILLAFVVMMVVAFGQGGGELDLGLDRAGGGGGESGAGRYVVTDSLGQPVAPGPPSSDGARYEWNDGFWEALKGFGESTVYLPLVIKDVP